MINKEFKMLMISWKVLVKMPKEPADDIKQKAFELPSKLNVAKQSAVKKQSGTQ